MVEESNGGFLIGQIKQRQARIFERILSDYGISEFNGAQGRILYVLWQSDHIPIVELSRQTGLAKTTLTSMLDRMEQANLLYRVYDTKDRRQIQIVLTEDAKRLSDTYQQVSKEMTELFYKGFKEDEIRQFELYLNRILGNLMEQEH